MAVPLVLGLERFDGSFSRFETQVLPEDHADADSNALVERGFTIFAAIPKGKVFDSMYDVLVQLVQQQEAELLAISNHKKVLELAQTPLRLPEKLPEWLSPIASIIPVQLFSYHLAKAKESDTKSPRSLSKITKTH